ncbi:IclR family transcriptional regulator [Haladaptatus halobius]|uniref:IclR family transcriptional regulator n=1 Tax=Haladaptatus halobius TaxID=2884875 RepID=UPI001D0B5195|nr:IclR family transcriptional regulator [Haladaptatus halobius]
MKPTRTVKAADTLFNIIQKLQQEDGAGVTELAQEIGMAKSTVYDHLMTLEQKEYVVKEEDTYRLSLRFLDHGVCIRNRIGMEEEVTSAIAQLAQDVNEAVWFVVEEHGNAVFIYKALGERAVQTHARIGRRMHLHHLAAGKSILANLPRNRVEEILAQKGLPERTEHTITDEETLFQELETVSENGVAHAKEETVGGVSSVAAPVIFEGEVRGAITVVGPSNRIDGSQLRDVLPELIRGTTNEIELKLTYG